MFKSSYIIWQDYADTEIAFYLQFRWKEKRWPSGFKVSFIQLQD